MRQSATVHIPLLYVAWRQSRGDDADRIVRVALPLTTVEAAAIPLRNLVLAGIILAAFLGLAVAVGLSRRMLRRTRRLVDFARTLAAGAPVPYLAPERDDDLGVLEAQFAEMAGHVATTIAELRLEQERSEAILRGMVEGVLVTDRAARVVLPNARVRGLLGAPRERRARPPAGRVPSRDPSAATRASAARSRRAYRQRHQLRR